MFDAFSRRRFMALSGAVGAAGAIGLAGCSNPSSTPSQSTAGLSGASSTLLPGAAPERWNEVLAAVNAKMQEEIGVTLDAQYYPWSNFAQQSLLRFTAGDKFDTGLQALWANLTQLVRDKALVDLTDLIGKYPNLTATVDKKLIDINAWDGVVYGVPQVNTAARVHHMRLRQDLAEKHGFDSIDNYDDWEKYLYTIKEKESGMTPFFAASGTAWIMAIPRPTAMFDAESWENPNTIPLSYGGKGFWFFPAPDAATTGSSAPVPFWEVPRIVETFKRIRKYYQDGIINADAISVDNATVTSQFIAGRYAATFAQTDGLSSAQLPDLQKAVPGAMLANIMPFRGGLSTKPNQTFQADNLVVVNARGGSVERALAIQDWLSIKENHDLLAYGVPGTDWEADGDASYKPLSGYNFPGYGLNWRIGLWRRPTTMTESENKIFTWSQSADNFTVDPFANFRPDDSSVSAEIVAMTEVMTEFGNPLYYGTVDVDSQIDKLKRAAEGAGLEKLLANLETQANAYLAAK